MAARVGGAFVGFHVRPGDRIVVAMFDSLEMAPVVLGAIRIGAVPVLVNPMLPPREVVPVAIESGGATTRILLPISFLAALVFMTREPFRTSTPTNRCTRSPCRAWTPRATPPSPSRSLAARSPACCQSRAWGTTAAVSSTPTSPTRCRSPTRSRAAMALVNSQERRYGPEGDDGAFADEAVGRQPTTLILDTTDFRHTWGGERNLRRRVGGAGLRDDVVDGGLRDEVHQDGPHASSRLNGWELL